MKYIRIIACLFLLFMQTQLSAQIARLYDSRYGLNNNRIHLTYQDKDGFIWIGAENGLTRFDGKHFFSMTYSKDKPSGIASNTVRSVLEDSKGRVWIGTSRGLQLFDTVYGTFEKFDLKDSRVPDSSQYIAEIKEIRSPDGVMEILIGSSQFGIYVLDGKSLEVNAEKTYKLNTVLQSKFVNKIFVDSRNWLWVASSVNGIDVASGASGSRITVKGLDKIADDVTVSSIIEDKKNGNVILGTNGKGIFIYDSSLGEIRKVEDPKIEAYSIMAMLYGGVPQMDNERIVILGTENHGFKFFDLDKEKLVDVYLPNVRYNTADWKIHSLMRDSQGNVWAGVYQNGLFVIPQSMFGFNYRGFNRKGDPGEKSACVTSVVEDPVRHLLYIATDGSGIFTIDRQGVQKSVSADNNPLGNNSVMDLVFDKRGTLWIATFLGGLFTYTPSGGFRQFPDQSSIGTIQVSALEYDDSRDLLYAGTHSMGFSIIDPLSQKVVKSKSDDYCKWINDLKISRDGTLWLATYNGLASYNSEKDSLSTYSFDFTSANVLAYTLKESSNGRILVGTADGLVTYNPGDRSSTLLSEKNGLSSNSVVGIQETKAGVLWLSTSYGLNKYNPLNGECVCYYLNDGIQDNQFQFNSAYMDSMERLYFGGVNGLTSFYPLAGNINTHAVPPIFFSGLFVDGENCNYATDQKKKILDRPITEASIIKLPNSSKTVTVRYSVPEFTNPNRLTYAYRIIPLEKEWNKNSKDGQTLSFTNLPHGKYTLQIKAFFEGAPSNFSSREIKIHKAPPAYLTTWAYILYLIVTCMIGGTVLNIRRNAAKHKKEKEDSEIMELKLKMFTNLSHEIRTPLTLVMSPLKTMRENETDQKKKDLFNLMYRNSLRILRTVNQIMDMRKVDNGLLKLHFQETDIEFFLKDVLKSFENFAYSKNIGIELQTAPESGKIWLDQGNFDKVVFNILSNAFKFTPNNGKIKISVSGPMANNGLLDSDVACYTEIAISNGGRHLLEDNPDKIFERYYQASSINADIGSGVGLHLTKQLVELHHGKIKAENTDDGFRVVMSIPLGKEHLNSKELESAEHYRDLYTKGSEDIDVDMEIKDESSDLPKTRKYMMPKPDRRIVAVDGNADMLGYLEIILKDEYKVECYSNIQDAWSAIFANVPDAVITDLKIEAETDGAELCRRIRTESTTNHVPIIILSADPEERTQQYCTDCGADKYLLKPISIELLKSSLSQVIATRSTIISKFTGKSVNYDYHSMKVNSQYQQLISKVFSLIKKNIDNPDFSVEDLSDAVGVSRVQLNRKLKEAINMSPGALIKSIRLKQAAYLMINNKVNVSEVVEKVGFATHSYFTSSFKDYFGMTPKAFTSKYNNVKNTDELNKLLGKF